ncbi:hypothetical protein J6590_081259 [Homalodisca vitripennis]|nr:hypothetical protein J6590_081259 [Homalodisca vitripennis]
MSWKFGEIDNGVETGWVTRMTEHEVLIQLVSPVSRGPWCGVMWLCSAQVPCSDVVWIQSHSKKVITGSLPSLSWQPSSTPRGGKCEGQQRTGWRELLRKGGRTDCDMTSAGAIHAYAIFVSETACAVTSVYTAAAACVAATFSAVSTGVESWCLPINQRKGGVNLLKVYKINK